MRVRSSRSACATTRCTWSVATRCTGPRPMDKWALRKRISPDAVAPERTATPEAALAEVRALRSEQQSLGRTAPRVRSAATEHDDGRAVGLATEHRLHVVQDAVGPPQVPALRSAKDEPQHLPG